LRYLEQSGDKELVSRAEWVISHFELETNLESHFFLKTIT